MKLVAITLLALIAAVVSSPTSISDNNIGDIVTVGVNAKLELSNKSDQNIISIIAALLNRSDDDDDVDGPTTAGGKAPANFDIDTFSKMFLKK